MVFLVYLVAVYFYSINLYMGTWRAANKYTGKAIWKILAKILVCLWWVILILQTIIMADDIFSILRG